MQSVTNYDSPVPTNHLDRLLDGLKLIPAVEIRDALKSDTLMMYEHAWKSHICCREDSDNSKMHELNVWERHLRIAIQSGGEGLSVTEFGVSEFRIAAAFDFFHDGSPLDRTDVTEESIKDAPEANRDRLKLKKHQARIDHMRKGAARAWPILKSLRSTGNASRALLSDWELLRTLGLIAAHDLFKTGAGWPSSMDWEAVIALESDLLYVLTAEGLKADWRRKGVYEPSSIQLRTMAQKNYDNQLAAYRANFQDTIEEEWFKDEETVIRTTAGHALLREYVKKWGIMTSKSVCDSAKVEGWNKRLE